MRGSDCTEDQLRSASDFLADRGWSDGRRNAIVERSEIVRIIAWYGALRYRAGQDGTGGTFETPGPFGIVETKKE